MAQTLYWVVCDTANAGYGNDDASAVRIQQGRNAAAALLPAGQVGNLPAPAVTGTVPAGVAATGLTPGASYTIAWTIWDGAAYGGGTATKTVVSAPFNTLSGTVYPVARAESFALTDSQVAAPSTYAVVRAESVALTDAQSAGASVYPVTRAESFALSDGQGASIAGGTCDPYYTSVELLLHGDGNLNDSSPLNLTPVPVGPITTVANGSAFNGQEISFSAVSQSYAAYTKAGGFLASPTGAFTLECFISITANPTCGTTGGPANDRGGFIRMLNAPVAPTTQQLMFSAVCLSGVPRMNWMIGSAGASAAVAWTQANRNYAAWTRSATGRNEFWLNGVFIDFVNDSTPFTFDTIVVGNSSGDNPVGGLIEEVRFTAGVARDVSTVPTTAFGNSQCVLVLASQDETISLVDTQNFVSTTVTATRAETVALSDAQTATVTAAGVNAVSETISFGDTQTARAIFNVGRADSFALTDTQTVPGVFQAARDESFTLSDAYQGRVDAGLCPGLPPGWVMTRVRELVPNPNFGTPYGQTYFTRWTYITTDENGQFVCASGADTDCCAQSHALAEQRTQQRPYNEAI